jgi:hypothetical protein
MTVVRDEIKKAKAELHRASVIQLGREDTRLGWKGG